MMRSATIDVYRAVLHCTRLMAAALVALCATSLPAQDSSPPPILQIFEARWDTIEDRMADIFEVGYGRLWLPPPARADSGNQSVGYDVYDRFDLGKPGNETLYGTELGLKTVVRSAHSAGLLVNTDFIPNHNGFSDSSTFDPGNGVSFEQAGGYPGFILSPDDGDFHGAFEGGQEFSRLSGLIDIAQEKNHQFIRTPVEAGNPQNIPAGSQGVFGRPPANVPDPNNARFYPDQGLGGITVFDNKGTSTTDDDETVTLYNFNTTTPLAGDAVSENAMGLLMRSARWMVQEIGVDGFRYDAGRHFPRWVLAYLDQAVFRAKTDTLLDGSPQHVFSFTETGYDANLGFLQSFIRKDINNFNLGQVGGNRDVLDFNLFGDPNSDTGFHHNLSANGFQNNWHKIKSASIDLNDDGLMNGSQGVKFAQSHDELGPYLQNVAYAYMLMLPGNALVYTNAKEFGNGRDFPRGGKEDALGGFHGETITKLVEIRNSHGRGNFHERWLDDAFNPNGFSNVYVYERNNSAIVGLNSRVDSFVEVRNGVQTGFASGAILVELTGNADDQSIDPVADPLTQKGDIPKTIRVNGSGQVDIAIPSNGTHGRGYVIYGLATPEGTLTLTDRGTSQVLAGATPTAANNGTARLADIEVVTSNTFNVQLNTMPVWLQDPDSANPQDLVRDVHADGDSAMIKIDGGLNINANPGIDDVSPGSVGYGFENFTTTRQPGYVWNGSTNVGNGSGTYVQTIDTTQLAEGRHYVTVRAFRHRDGSSGGDGGPAVFTDFKKTIYVDRLPPESEVASFDAFASNPGNPNNRDLIVRSVDATADSVHVFLDLPATMTEAQILAQVGSGNQAGAYDRDLFKRGFTNLPTGNHVATIVTFEPTGNKSIQRVAGLFADTNIGAGFGDMNSAGGYTTADIRCFGGVCSNFSMEDVLYSKNTKFRAAFDVNGDGLGDNRDLFLLGNELVSNGASQSVLDDFTGLLLHRGDFNNSSTTNAGDVAALYQHMNIPISPNDLWLYDLNVDGAVDTTDVQTMVTEVFRSVVGDFNLDGAVDAGDYVVWRKSSGATSGARFTDGDADLDGDVDQFDLAAWKTNFGFTRQPLQAGGSGAGQVPEPTAMAMIALAGAMAAMANSRCSRHGKRRALYVRAFDF